MTSDHAAVYVCERVNYSYNITLMGSGLPLITVYNKFGKNNVNAMETSIHIRVSLI